MYIVFCNSILLGIFMFKNHTGGYLIGFIRPGGLNKFKKKLIWHSLKKNHFDPLQNKTRAGIFQSKKIGILQGVDFTFTKRS